MKIDMGMLNTKIVYVSCQKARTFFGSRPKNVRCGSIDQSHCMSVMYSGADSMKVFNKLGLNIRKKIGMLPMS